MEQPPSASGSPPAEPPPKMSLAARLLNIFAIPGEVFDEVKAAGAATGNWLAPALLSCVVGVFAVIIMFSQPAIIQGIHEQQQKMFDGQVKAGKMTREQADQAAAVAEKFSGPTLMKITGSVGAVLVSFARVFWWAFVLWLLGLLFLKTKFSYLKAAEMAGLATMISLLGGMVALLLTVSLGKPAAPSLALAVDTVDAKNKLHLLLAALNVFDLWLIGLMAAALARLAGARFSKSLILVAGYWLALQCFFMLLGTLAGGLTPAGK